MKKFFSLFAAVLFASSMMAGVVTITPASITDEDERQGSFDKTIEGINLVWEGAYYNGGTKAENNDLRIYASKSMTISCATENIVKIEIAGKTKKDQAITVNKGTVTTGASYASETTKSDIDDPLIVISSINSSSVTITCVKQLQCRTIRVTTGEGGEGGGSGEGGEGEGGGSGEAGDDVCEVTATGKWSFVESYYDLYDDGSVDINLFTTAGWYFDEEGNLYGAGAGAVAVLDIVPADQSDLVGTYSVADGTLDPTYCFFVEYASDEDEEGTSYELESGTVVIALNEQGTAYTLTYDLTFSDASVGAGTINGLCLVGGGEEGIEDIVLTEKAQKVSVDGAVYVIRDNKMYNVTGTRVR